MWIKISWVLEKPADQDPLFFHSACESMVIHEVKQPNQWKFKNKYFINIFSRTRLGADFDTLFFYFCMKTCVVGTHLKHIIEKLLMSTYNNVYSHSEFGLF